MNATTVQDYADALTNGAEFPPVVVFHDGTDHWLADGFHRLLAHEKAGLVDILADVRQGTKRDALLFAVVHRLELALDAAHLVGGAVEFRLQIRSRHRAYADLG
jgi:hypothetical protein